MTIHELAARFNLKPLTIRGYVARRIIPPPYGTTRNASYGLAHIEAIEAYIALKNNNVYPAQALAHCQEAGISLRQYVLERERSIRLHGIGIG